MAKVYDVPAEKLIAKLADQLKKDKKNRSPDLVAICQDRLACTKDSPKQRLVVHPMRFST